MKTNKKRIKSLNIIIDIFIYMFLILCMLFLIICIHVKKDSDGAVTIFGYQTRIVVSESMEKCESTYDEIKKYKIRNIPVKSLVLIKTVPNKTSKQSDFYSKIKIGDVLTFKYVVGTKQETITHRVIKIYEDGNDSFIELRGDNVLLTDNINTTSQIINIDDSNSPNFIIGKVIFKSYTLGAILFALKKPLGMFLIIIIPTLIIMIFEIVKVVNYIYIQKKTKTEKQIELQREELEKLKLKLIQLENKEGDKCV